MPKNDMPFFIAKLCSLLTLLIALTVIIGWHAHLLQLIQLKPSYSPMQFNTALSFIFVSIGLLCAINGKYKAITLISALCVSLISGITLIEYGFHTNVGIDDLFIESYFTASTIYPGRMAPITACGFITTALLLFSYALLKDELRFFFIRLFSSLVLIFGLVPFTGYLTGVELAYSLGQFTGMALQTAGSYILIGLSATAYLWQFEKLKAQNSVAIWLSMISSISLMLFTIALWQENINKEREFIEKKVVEEASLLEHRLRDEMSYSIVSLRRMAQRFTLRGGTPEGEWRHDARNFIEDTKAVKALLWIDSAYHIRWVEPLTNKDTLINDPVFFNQKTKKVLLENKNHLSIIITPPVYLAQGYPAVLVYIPIYVKGRLKGFITGIYDSNELMEQVMPPYIKTLFYIQLMDGNSIVYRSSKEQVFTHDLVKTSITLANQQWELYLKAKPIFFQEHLSFMPYLQLIGGLLFSLFLGSTLYYALTATQRNKLLIQKSEALLRSEEYQQQLINAVHDYAIFGIDTQGNVVSWNSGAERIKGYKSDEIIGRNFSVFFTEEDRSNFLPQTTLKTAAKNEKYVTERWSVRKDGMKYWVNSTVEVIKNKDNTIIGFVVISQDISKRRFLELEHAKLIAIIEDSADYIGMSDLEGHLLFHNRCAKKLVGLGEDADMSQMSIADMHPKWAYDLIHDIGLPEVFKYGTWSAETALLHQITKAEIPVLQTITLHRDIQGNPICLTTIMRDITERKKAEIAQKNLINELSNSNLELERFAYVASHDMQEPLRMIVSFSDIIMNEYASELVGDAKQYLEIVHDSGNRMQEIIQDLLEYSRISREAKIIKQVNGAMALEHALKNIHLYIEETKAEISFDVPPDFLGNPFQITRLLQNLITNAIKYRTPGLNPRIHIGVEERAESWCIRVRDNGLGIPTEFKEHIFQPFRRLHSWDKIKGTGIGLAICKKIVENHGGMIWVEQAPEQGSIFCFTIPKARENP